MKRFFKECVTKILIGGWTELHDFFNAKRAFDLKICPKLTTALLEASLFVLITSMSAKRFIPPLKKSMYPPHPLP